MLVWHCCTPNTETTVFQTAEFTAREVGEKKSQSATLLGAPLSARASCRLTYAPNSLKTPVGSELSPSADQTGERERTCSASTELRKKHLRQRVVVTGQVMAHLSRKKKSVERESTRSKREEGTARTCHYETHRADAKQLCLIVACSS